MPMDRYPAPVPPTNASIAKTREAIIPVRARVRDGQIVSLLDQAGNEMGLPVTATPSDQGLVNSPDVSAGLAILNNQSGATLKKLVAKALAGGVARLAVISDSTGVGAGAGTGTALLTGARAKNWLTRLAQLLTAMGIPAYNRAIVGWQLGASGATWANYDPALALTNFTAQSLPCLGGHAFKAAASGAVLQYTIPGNADSVDIYTADSNGNGSFTVQIDGGATLATINTSNATHRINKTTVTFTRGSGRVLTCTTTSASTTFIAAIVPYDSVAGGLELLQACWYGSKAVDHISDVEPWHPMNELSSLTPDATIVQLTINDSNAGTAVADYASALSFIAGKITAAGSDAIWMTGIESNNAASTNGTLDALCQAVKDRATADSKLLIDLRAMLGPYSKTNGLGWMGDNNHGNGNLYAHEALRVARLIRDIATV